MWFADRFARDWASGSGREPALVVKLALILVVAAALVLGAAMWICIMPGASIARLAVRRWPAVGHGKAVRWLMRRDEPVREWWAGRPARKVAKQAKHEKRMQEDWAYRLGSRMGDALENALARAWYRSRSRLPRRRSSSGELAGVTLMLS